MTRLLRTVPPGERAAPRLEDLLPAVARGDNPAYESLYSQVSGPIYGLALRVLRDPAQAQEVAQEVLLQIWREAARFDPDRGSAMAWVMTRAHRRAVDRVRSEQSTTDRQHRRAAGEVEICFDSVAEAVEHELDREAVRNCLETLTALQRQALTSAYYDGRTYREVAEDLDLPLGTVKTRIRDGLRRLRDCLGVVAG